MQIAQITAQKRCLFFGKNVCDGLFPLNHQKKRLKNEINWSIESLPTQLISLIFG